MSPLSTPHDRYFRETFARPEIARDFLRNYLPPEIRARLELSTLSLSKESFVDPDLRQHFSDLLYEIETVGNDPGYVYLLFEHKSYPDPLTVFQMLRYCVRIWERALRADSSLTQLPPIIPLLVYHGEQTWNAPRDMIELLAGDEAFHIYGPRFSCSLLDLSPWSETEIKGKILLRVVLQAFRSVRNPRLGQEQLPQMLELLAQLTEKESAVEYIQTLLVYLGAASPHLTAEEVQAALEETIAKEGEQLMPTLASKWFEEGLEQGIEQGREQGIEQGLGQGERLGVLRTLTGLLEHRFGPLDPVLVAHLQSLNVNQLQELSLFALDAVTIDQVADQALRLRSTP